MIEDTKQLLQLWGEWSRYGVGVGKVRSCIEIYCDRMLGSTVAVPRVSDEDAGLVESAVVSLMSHDSAAADVLCLFFIGRFPVYRIQESRSMSRERVNVLLNCAIGHVDGVLAFQEKVSAA